MKKREIWKEVNTDIDFSKYEPVTTNSSFHIYEERYIIGGNTYRLLSGIIGQVGEEPTIEILIDNKK